MTLTKREQRLLSRATARPAFTLDADPKELRQAAQMWRRRLTKIRSAARSHEESFVSLSRGVDQCMSALATIMNHPNYPGAPVSAEEQE